MRVLDKDTFQISLKGAYPPFLELLSMPGFGIIGRHSTPSNIIGSGPYTFTTESLSDPCLQKLPAYRFSSTNISRYCFIHENDAEKIIKGLISKSATLAIGAPLEVALSPQLNPALVSRPTFSLVTTNIIINNSNAFFKLKKNRMIIAEIARFARAKKDVLTRFDSASDNFLPRGIMPESYYKHLEPSGTLPVITTKEKLRILFPQGIFLKSSVEKIAATFSDAGFDVTYLDVKGNDLLNPLIKGEFDLAFIPYHGVISDADGYLDLLDPNSVLSKAELPTNNFLQELAIKRFTPSKEIRLEEYEKAFEKLESELYFVPFSQNSIPIVSAESVVLPDLNFSYHLNLRELSIDEAK
jgi:hypothetical protein